MATTSPWPLIHAEREALIADLDTLTDEQWATPSLCGDWTVRDVLGHMISTAKRTEVIPARSAALRSRAQRAARLRPPPWGWTGRAGRKLAPPIGHPASR
jgi:uncharacterized protein (TIGR03083 family)